MPQVRKQLHVVIVFKSFATSRTNWVDKYDLLILYQQKDKTITKPLNNISFLLHIVWRYSYYYFALNTFNKIVDALSDWTLFLYIDIYESHDRRPSADLADLATPVEDNRELILPAGNTPTSILITLEGATCTLYDETLMPEVSIFNCVWESCEKVKTWSMAWR